VVRMC